MLTLSRGEWRLPPRGTFVTVFGDCRDMAVAAGTALNTNKQTNKQAVYGGRKVPRVKCCMTSVTVWRVG